MIPICVRGVSVFISREARELWDNLNEAISELPQEVSCRESDPDAWFPDEEAHGSGKTTYLEVKKMCQRCPVQALCLEYALANKEHHGMWGGMSSDERKNLMRRARRKQA